MPQERLKEIAKRQKKKKKRGSAGVGVPLNEERAREVIWHLYRFPVFVLLWQLSCFISHTWPDSGPSLICLCIFWPRGIPGQRVMGWLTGFIMAWPTLPFWIFRAFLYMYSWGGLLDPRRDWCGRVIFLLQQSWTPAINFLPEMSKRTKAQLFSAQRPVYLLLQYHVS